MPQFSKLWKLLTTNIGIRQTIVKNFIWRSGSTVLYKGVRFLVLMSAAAALGPTSFGRYSYLFALVSLAFIFSDWGLNVLLIRDYQQQQNREKIVATALWLKAAMAVLSVGVAVILLLFSEPQEWRLGLIIAGILAITEIRDFWVSYYLAEEHAQREFVLTMAEAVAMAIFYWFIFWPHPTPAWLAIFYLCSATAGVIFATLAGRQEMHLWSMLNFDWPTALAYLKNGFYLALFGIAGYLFFSIDQLFIKHYTDLTQVGFYSLATRIVLATLLLSSVLTSVLQPLLSRSVGDKPAFNKIFVGGVWLLGVSGLLVALVMVVLAPYAIPFFFGAQFVPSIRLIQLLSPIVFLLFVNNILDHVLIAHNWQLADFLVTLGAAVVNVILNFVFVPTLGAPGAILASILAQGLNLVATFVLVRLVLKFPKPTIAHAAS